MKRPVFAGIISVVLCSVQANAQEMPYPDYFHNGKPTIMHGQGSRSCGTFLEDKKPDNIQTGAHAQDMAWVLGFLHGIDTWNPYDTKYYEYNGLDLYLEEYCKAHPIDELVNAANQFYSAIGGRAPMSQDYSIWQHYPANRKRLNH